MKKTAEDYLGEEVTEVLFDGKKAVGVKTATGEHRGDALVINAAIGACFSLALLLFGRPFYRALGTNVDGSGLGLAIVHEIASAHGAEVSVTDAHPRSGPSAAAPGALFTVRFPVQEADANG